MFNDFSKSKSSRFFEKGTLKNGSKAEGALDSLTAFFKTWLSFLSDGGDGVGSSLKRKSHHYRSSRGECKKQCQVCSCQKKICGGRRRSYEMMICGAPRGWRLTTSLVRQMQLTWKIARALPPKPQRRTSWIKETHKEVFCNHEKKKV